MTCCLVKNGVLQHFRQMLMCLCKCVYVEKDFKSIYWNSQTFSLTICMLTWWWGLLYHGERFHCQGWHFHVRSYAEWIFATCRNCLKISLHDGLLLVWAGKRRKEKVGSDKLVSDSTSRFITYTLYSLCIIWWVKHMCMLISVFVVQ